MTLPETATWLCQSMLRRPEKPTCSPCRLSTANCTLDPVLALGGAKEILLGAPGQRPVAGLEPLGDSRVVEPLESVIEVLVTVERHQPHLLAFPSISHGLTPIPVVRVRKKVKG